VNVKFSPGRDGKETEETMKSRTTVRAVALAALTALAVGQMAQAAVVLDIDNAGFETPTPLSGGDWQNFIAGQTAGGWTFEGGQTSQILDRSGNQLLGFYYDNGVWQDLYSGASPVTIAAGDVYSISVDLGETYGPGNAFGYVTVGIRDSVSGTVLTSWTSTEHPTALQTYSFDLTIPASPTGAGNTARLFIAAPATQALAGTSRSGVDNVAVLYTAIPEPASIGMFGVMTAALLLRRRFRG
jgi:hypothetical protein